MWKLLPKVHRTEADPSPASAHESDIAEQFKARAAIRHGKDCPPADDDFGWLALMQHFGLPTRLLDWTRSILVAAYFAVAGQSEDNPPAIWALHPHALNETQPPDNNFHVGETSYLVHAFAYAVSPTHPYVQALARCVFRSETQHEHFSGRAHGTIAVIPPEKDLRMLVQYATFTIHEDSQPLEEHPGASDFLLKFPVAKSCRETMYDTLECLHIDRSSLFPDLDRLSDEIAKPGPSPA
jgi:hypothetical protein